MIFQPTGVTDASGVVTGAIASTVAESKTISATAIANGTTTAVGGTATIEFSQTAQVPTQLAFIVEPASAAAGATLGPVRVEIQDAAGAIVLTANHNITVGLLANPAGGVLLGTQMQTAATGEASFADLVIERAGAGYTLFAMADGLFGATSAPFSVTAGAAGAFEVSVTDPFTALTVNDVTVSATDTFGNPSADYVGTVTFATTDPVGVVPIDYTFTAGDAGSHSFPMELFLGTPGVQAVWAIDTADSSVTGAGTATVSADINFEVIGIADPLGRLIFSDVTVTALDGGGTVATNYRGTIDFAATTAADLPAPYTFSAADAGTHTFFGAVSLHTTGTHAVSVTDGFGVGSQIDIEVTDAPPVVTGLALYIDSDADGFVDAGDELIVPFTEDLTLNSPSGVDFAMPVSGDSLGAGATVAAGPRANEVTITLGSSASLRARHIYEGAAVGANAPSGIDVAAVVGADAIEGPSGVDAIASVPIDIVAVFDRAGAVAFTFNINALVTGDLDADGDPDLIIGSYSISAGVPNMVWINQGGAQGGTAGAFVDSLQDLGSFRTRDLALGDLDHDGDLDLVDAHNAGCRILTNTGGSGVMTDSGQVLGTADTLAVALDDVDDDGDLDIIMATSGGNRVWLNQGGAQAGTLGTFADSGQTLLTTSQSFVGAGDIDLDGDLDFITGSGSSVTADILVNEGRAQAGVPGDFAWLSSLQTSQPAQSAAFGDLDRDGDLDLALGTLSSLEIWVNQGGAQGGTTGSFIRGTNLPASNGAQEIDLADLDGDGLLDVVTSIMGGSSAFWLGDGTGGFIGPIQAVGTGRVHTLGDLDNDGDLDILDGTSTDVSLFFGSASGSRGGLVLADSGQTLGSGGTGSLVFGDLNADGALDMVAGLSGANVAWLNDGSGGFVDAGVTLGTADTLAVALGDVDNDGTLDLVAGNGGATGDTVWLGDGAGGFVDSGQALGSTATTAIVLGDLDRDGDLDFVAAADGANTVWLNDGGVQAGTIGQFQAAGTFGTSTTLALALGDIDADGALDLVTGNDAGQLSILWTNDRFGGFTDSGQNFNSARTAAVAIADVDNDGDQDVVTGISGGQANVVWLNDGSAELTNSGANGHNLGSSDTNGLIVVDINVDGWLDIVAGNATANRVWLNDRAGSYYDAGLALGSAETLTLAVGDLDHDGGLDLAAGGAAAQGDTVWLSQ